MVKVHQQLDKAVGSYYRPQPFTNETKPIEFLFELYDNVHGGFVWEGEEGTEEEGRVKTRYTKGWLEPSDR